MNKLRVLLVDDEPLARDRLRALLGAEPSVEIAGECASGREAIAAIKAAPPDLVFLDMQMPGCDGLQVLAELPEAKRPAVIFATAHERFAVDAFDVAAVDYLLKPFDRERLRTAVRRAHEHLARRRAGEAGRAPESPAEATPATQRNERLTVKADGRLVFLRSDEIVWAEAADNYVVLHLVSGRLMVRETMTALEARLGAQNFQRVNRSALVHRDQIKELQPGAHGDYSVLLRDGTKLPLSRHLRGQLDRIAGGSA
ncbi:MAG TPA: LytTR family DNA-binding domain-containing protein [Lacunisphaera sp.]|nr:LytTR family DNA-binding domain-containing protein [Lacunisphaera sp.]